MVNQPTPRVGPSQVCELKHLIDQIKGLKAASFIDDFEQQYAYAVSVRDCVLQLQATALPLLSGDTATRLSSLDGDVDTFSSASGAHATIDAIIPIIEDVLSKTVLPTPQTQGNCTGHCPKCGADRNALILAQEEDVQIVDPPPGETYLRDVFRILRCLGCDAVYVQKESHFSPEMELRRNPSTGRSEEIPILTIKHWPLPRVREIPDWARRLDDAELRDLLFEIYSALDAGHHVLAAIGTRTAFDRAFVLKGADETHNFRDKQAALTASGVISQAEANLLAKLIHAGHAAAHRAWKPDRETLLTLITGLETFLYQTLVQAPEVEAVSEAVPPRTPTPRKKAAAS